MNGIIAALLILFSLIIIGLDIYLTITVSSIQTSLSPVTCGTFDCSKEKTNTRSRPSTTSCKRNPCTATDCCMKPEELPTCGNFDCSQEEVNKKTKVPSTKCQANPCTATDCCMKPEDDTDGKTSS